MGGTWHYNTYPGCACDVPSNLYSFSFAPNPDWTRTYSRQPEIRAYLERVVDEFDVRSKIQLNTEVTAASTGTKSASAGALIHRQGEVTAKVLVSGTGPLAEPKIPDLPGLEPSQGPTLHSARWDHSVDLRGQRVASIGTGASAIQYVPAIAPTVEQLHVFQRTPPWVMPHSARPVTRVERRLYRRLPLAQRAVRGAIYAARELLVLGFVKQPRGLKLLERIAARHRERSLRDPELIAAGDPRLHASAASASCRPTTGIPRSRATNVELVTDGVREVARAFDRAARTGASSKSTRSSSAPASTSSTCRSGGWCAAATARRWPTRWDGSPHAHLGCTVPGFPNLFILLGPNTGLGHSSMVYMIESQIAYVMDALRDAGARDVIEVRPEVEARFNAELQRRMRGTVWNTGCMSWYQDARGSNPTLWPDWTWRFRRRTARFDPSEYVLA